MAGLTTFNSEPKSPMYAISIDLDLLKLRLLSLASSDTPYTLEDAYTDIAEILVSLDFKMGNGICIYWGNKSINAVTCVLAAQKLAKDLPWFSKCLKHCRMFRIVEQTDLMAAILI